jgi:acyl-coenzyme A thioesterase PaaI-like protein
VENSLHTKESNGTIKENNSGKDWGAMRKQSRFERNMLMEVTEVRDDGITMHGNLYKDFNNVYGIAHGGYLYTVSHMAAEVCGELCLGGKWEVRSAECLFLQPLRIYPSVIRAVWVNKDPAYPMVRVEVHDSKGALCFELNATLSPAPSAPKAPM